METAKLSIQAEVATDFFTLHALDAEIALLRSSVEVFQEIDGFDAQRRRAGGVATDLDVAQAETVLKTTEALLPATILSRIKVEHALAVLTGRARVEFRGAGAHGRFGTADFAGGCAVGVAGASAGHRRGGEADGLGQREYRRGQGGFLSQGSVERPGRI